MQKYEHTCRSHMLHKIKMNQKCNVNIYIVLVTMDHSLPLGSSVHGIFQARTLVWFAYSFSRGSSRDRTQVPWTAGRFFTNWTTREAHNVKYNAIKLLEEKVGENLHDLFIWWWIFRYNTKNTIHERKKKHLKISS